MEVYPLHSIEGAYWYLIAVIVAGALGLVLYFGAVAAGLAPDLTAFFP